MMTITEILLTIIIQKTLKESSQYHELILKLKKKQSKCLQSQVNKQQINICLSGREHFEHYLEQYSHQFREKGYNMCSKMMKEQPEISAKIALKDKCIEFYSKSLPIFKENVLDKLRSVINSTDFSQL